MAAVLSAWQATAVAPALLEAAQKAVARLGVLGTVGRGARAVVRYLAEHTGVPALVVAAVLVVVGYRILKRSARFAVEVAVVAVLLACATRFGWIRW